MIRKDKRSSFGGKLGDELNEIWSALAANRIIPHGGMSVEESSSGIVLKPKAEGSSSASDGGGSSIIQVEYESFESKSTTLTQSPYYDEHWFADTENRVIAGSPLGVDEWVSKSPQNALIDFNYGYNNGAFTTNQFRYPSLPYLLKNSFILTGGYQAAGWSQPHDQFAWDATYPIYTFITPVDPPLILPIIDPSSSYSLLGDNQIYNIFSSNIFQDAYGWHIRCDYIELNLDKRNWDFQVLY